SLRQMVSPSAEEIRRWFTSFRKRSRARLSKSSTLVASRNRTGTGTARLSASNSVSLTSTAVFPVPTPPTRTCGRFRRSRRSAITTLHNSSRPTTSSRIAPAVGTNSRDPVRARTRYQRSNLNSRHSTKNDATASSKTEIKTLETAPQVKPSDVHLRSGSYGKADGPPFTITKADQPSHTRKTSTAKPLSEVNAQIN